MFCLCLFLWLYKSYRVSQWYQWYWPWETINWTSSIDPRSYSRNKVYKFVEFRAVRLRQGSCTCLATKWRKTNVQARRLIYHRQQKPSRSASLIGKVLGIFLPENCSSFKGCFHANRVGAIAIIINDYNRCRKYWFGRISCLPVMQSIPDSSPVI